MLGCLAEKQLTTPQQYPLTLNALVLACNQSSNRDPVVSYDERAVEQAVTRAKERGLARFVHPSHGRSVLRYRHELDAHFGIDERQLALLAVLLLRGPQTVGELRARTERMAPFAELAEVEAELAALARRQEPLVVRLDRQPGRKEERYTHGFGAAAVSPGAEDLVATGAEPSGPAGEVPPAARPAPPGPGTDLAEELALLRADVAALRRDLDDLRAQLGA